MDHHVAFGLQQLLFLLFLKLNLHLMIAKRFYVNLVPVVSRHFGGQLWKTIFQILLDFKLLSYMTFFASFQTGKDFQMVLNV